MSGTLAPSTPTNRRLSGITAASVNGTAYSVIEFMWDPANVENSTMASLSGIDGFDQKPVAAFISGKFRDTGANSVTSFTGMSNATVVFLLANGKQIVGHGVWYVGRPNVSGADAGFDFRFEGVNGTIMEIQGKS
jgi:hypothetical protein